MRPLSDNLSWEQLYAKEKVETMHWYYPTLDPDLKAALRKMNITSGTILDLGTGPGTQAIALARIGFNVTATDISITAVRKAKKKSEQERVNVVFRQDNVLDSKLEEEFDYIFDRGLFHVLPPENRDRYIGFVGSHLKSKGTYFLKCFSYKEQGKGPYRFTPKQITDYFSSFFEILSISETIYQGTRKPLPKALFIVMGKR